MFLLFLLPIQAYYFYLIKQNKYFTPVFNPCERSSCFGGKAAAFALPSHVCTPIILSFGGSTTAFMLLKFKHKKACFRGKCLCQANCRH
jgi:hypothetical protein